MTRWEDTLRAGTFAGLAIGLWVAPLLSITEVRAVSVVACFTLAVVCAVRSTLQSGRLK